MIKAVVLAAALNLCFCNPGVNEQEEALRSLNEVENLEIMGDFVTIASKNSTRVNSTDSDDFDKYLHTHVIRIKVPLLRNKYVNFELSDLVWDDNPEGRKKRMRLRELLVPLLLGLKHKLTVVLPLFMACVMAIALKGFWAGVTGLFVSKLVGLKLLLQSQDKQDDNHDEGSEDHNSDSPLSFEFPYQSGDEEEHEDHSKPVVVHLHSDRRSGKVSRRRKESPPTIRRHPRPKIWDPKYGIGRGV